VLRHLQPLQDGLPGQASRQPLLNYAVSTRTLLSTYCSDPTNNALAILIACITCGSCRLFTDWDSAGLLALLLPDAESIWLMQTCPFGVFPGIVRSYPSGLHIYRCCYSARRCCNVSHHGLSEKNCRL
jgi:hypothetical protein